MHLGEEQVIITTITIIIINIIIINVIIIITTVLINIIITNINTIITFTISASPLSGSGFITIITIVIIGIIIITINNIIRIRLCISLDGASLSRLWEEVKAWLFHLSSTSGEVDDDDDHQDDDDDDQNEYFEDFDASGEQFELGLSFHPAPQCAESKYPFTKKTVKVLLIISLKTLQVSTAILEPYNVVLYTHTTLEHNYDDDDDNDDDPHNGFSGLNSNSGALQRRLIHSHNP